MTRDTVEGPARVDRQSDSAGEPTGTFALYVDGKEVAGGFTQRMYFDELAGRINAALTPLVAKAKAGEKMAENVLTALGSLCAEHFEGENVTISRGHWESAVKALAEAHTEWDKANK